MRANYASLTMPITGILILFFIVFHLFDLTWGTANPQFESGEVYNNVVTSLDRWYVGTIYIVANLLLGLHLYHGAWSFFQSLGWNPSRFAQWRRYFALAFTAVIVIGNVSFPIAVMTGVVS
jgi:succinate dehydrogenase / fumarate reductase cytochrome b subunit